MANLVPFVRNLHKYLIYLIKEMLTRRVIMKYSVKNAKKAFLTLIEKLNSLGAAGRNLRAKLAGLAAKIWWGFIELA